MSKQFNFNNLQPIGPIYGYLHELGKPISYIGWDAELTRHYKSRPRNCKQKTLRTHRTGDCAKKQRKVKHKCKRRSIKDNHHGNAPVNV